MLRIRRASVILGGARVEALKNGRIEKMSNVDTRQVNRDSLFLLAQLKVDGRDGEARVKVRNLSPGGMMAEGDVAVTRGSLVSVELRNLGWVEGTVAWKQENRFGIAFVNDIDPAAVRAPAASEESSYTAPRFTRTHQATHQAVPISQRDDSANLRKI